VGWFYPRRGSPHQPKPGTDTRQILGFFAREVQKSIQLNNILHGPALDQLKTLDSESVDCCITSPPYWALRDYKTEGQIWDAVNGCAHEWDITNVMQSRKGKGHAKSTLSITSSNSEKSKGYYDDNTQFSTITNFCSKCNAWKGSLGLEPTFQLYIKHLIEIFNEVRRVLKKEGSCWVNMGDTYAQANIRNRNGLGSDTAQQKEGVNFLINSRDKQAVPEKSLCLIPQRFQIAMVDQGWICRNTIIWYKPNCMPSSAKDRFTVDFEYLFFFTKSQKYYFETQYETSANEPDQQYRKWRAQRNTCEGQRWKYQGYSDEQVVKGGTESHFLNPPNPLGRIKRCVWKIPTQPFSEPHFAVFPPALVETPLKACCPEYICKRCGKAREKIIQGERILTGQKQPSIRQKMDDTGLHFWSVNASRKTLLINDAYYIYRERGLTDCGCNAGFDGGIVLDPFMGSGTVALVAMQNARNFLGIELSQAYIDMAMKRLEPYLLQTRLQLG
jgi:DNA modification methylase